ncbi:Hypothetical predicted protein [Cloeon dipterum]|uniref:Uncharacterized protein n=1 Tax=Cloeon dipterum TaxID=197152 RepID=A0A8S1CJE3_9INSE|nr:Hypothetical predicted protein [Cloeon dipterum]
MPSELEAVIGALLTSPMLSLISVRTCLHHSERFPPLNTEDYPKWPMTVSRMITTTLFFVESIGGRQIIAELCNNLGFHTPLFGLAQDVLPGRSLVQGVNCTRRQPQALLQECHVRTFVLFGAERFLQILLGNVDGLLVNFKAVTNASALKSSSDGQGATAHAQVSNHLSIQIPERLFCGVKHAGSNVRRGYVLLE